MVTDGVPDLDPLLNYLAKTLELKRAGLETELSRATASAQLVKDLTHSRVLRYRVSLTSLWSNEGEESVVVTRRGPLDAVIRFAKTKFKRVNHRNDIQADWNVYAMVPSADGKSIQVPVPDTFWSRIRYET